MAGCLWGEGEEKLVLQIGAPTGCSPGAEVRICPCPRWGWAAGGGRKLPSALTVACGKGLPVTSCPDLAPRADQGKDVGLCSLCSAPP